MANQSGIAIVIKGFIPTGKALEDQLSTLTAVKKAHETGDYSELLKLATIEEVKTEQKTRRVETVATSPAPVPATEDASGLKAAFDAVSPVGDIDATEPVGTVADAIEGDNEPSAEDVPAFLKGKGRAA